MRLLGLVLSGFTLQLLVHLVLRAVRLDEGPSTRAVLAALYLLTATLGIAWVALSVPGHDARCVAVCDLGPVSALADRALARELLRAQLGASLILALGLVVWVAWRFVRSSQAVRRSSTRRS